MAFNAWFITVHKRSCGKVMLSEACMKNSVHRRGQIPDTSHPPGRHPSWQDTPTGQTPPGQADTPLGRHPPQARHPQADSYCSGRYASYWNAFLFISLKSRNSHNLLQIYAFKSNENNSKGYKLSQVKMPNQIERKQIKSKAITEKLNYLRAK